MVRGAVSWIALQGAANARDLGGLPLVGGGTTRAGVLWRADNLQGLTAADVALLRERGLGTVVDLRSPFEVDNEGPGPLVGVVPHARHSLLPEVGKGTDVDADGEVDALLTRRRDLRAQFPATPSVGFYLAYLDDRPESVVGALHAVRTAEGAALVHCAAGKDRTGVVVALALSVAGVTPDAIVADYAASGDRIGAILARLRASPTYAADLDRQPDDAHRPRAQTMEVWLHELDTRHGGAGRWLDAHGFGADEQEALRRRLTG